MPPVRATMLLVGYAQAVAYCAPCHMALRAGRVGSETDGEALSPQKDVQKDADARATALASALSASVAAASAGRCIVSVGARAGRADALHPPKVWQHVRRVPRRSAALGVACRRELRIP